MTDLKFKNFFQNNPGFLKYFDKPEYAWQLLVYLKEIFQPGRLGNIDIEIPKNVWIDDPSIVSIGKGTTIEPGVYIKGPCIIGENNTIRQGAYIREHVITGKGCLIGHDTEIKHSVLFDHVKAAHFAYIGDSVIGNDVNLGAGVICANFRFDGAEIPVRIEGQKHPTGLKKLGAIIADNVKVGCNSVLNPGTVIGSDTLIYPCTNASGSIPNGSVVKQQSAQHSTTDSEL